jgi:hypothetical protein
MKVVINNCFGGFSLSPAAVARFAELKGRPCFFFVRNIAKSGIHAKPERVTAKQATEAFMFFAYDVPNPDEVLPKEDRWQEMTMEQRQASNAEYERHSIPIGREIQRDDPDLLRVVEELGEAASGKHAKLKVVEIPDGVEYVIEEYDGNEHVAESHMTWR